MRLEGTLPHVLAAPAADPTLASFYQLTWWLVLLKVVVVFVFLLLTTMFMIWAERRVIGRMQNRPGPNRAGPFGLLQPIADALKLPLKEDIIPTTADKLIFVVAPVLSAAPAFVAFSIIPVGPVVSIFHHRTPLQVTDLPVCVGVTHAATDRAIAYRVHKGFAHADVALSVGVQRMVRSDLGAAGVMFGLVFGQIFHFMGFLAGLKGFTAAVIGGIGSIPGAMIGGLIVGLAESYATGYLPQGSTFQNLYVFALLILVILIRPSGLFGTVVVQKA